VKILITEDELKTGEYLKQGLTEAGYLVDWVRDGQSALNQVFNESYDLIILDVMLPLIDGWTLLSEIRRADYWMPVLFLSAQSHLDDRVKGLELGADDYLIKPFAFTELLARIKTLLRRSQQQESDIIHVADIELDLRRRRVVRAGRRIDLTAKEFLLLELFMRRQGEILPRSLIASQVWDMNFESDTNVVEVAIKRLRNKIDQDFHPKLIKTIRGMGYVLETEIEENR
jgi:two-component system copper resistance phosphate regulon response regulator CusR